MSALRWACAGTLVAASGCFIAYGLLGEWGHLTVDDMADGSARETAVILTGSGVFLFGGAFVALAVAIGIAHRARRPEP